MQSYKNLFKNLPDTAKVWIYQSSRALTDQETQQAELILGVFVREWTSHAEKVTAEGAIIYNRFIVLAVDESLVALGGCSIDSSVKTIRQLEQQFNITLLDRLTVAYREGVAIKTATQQSFINLFEQGVIHPNTIVFNNTVSTLSGFYENWEIPVSKSWHKRWLSTAKSSTALNTPQ